MSAIFAPDQRLRELAVNTAAFAAWVGVTVDDYPDPEELRTAARAYIDISKLAGLTPERIPRLLILSAPYSGRRTASGGNAFRHVWNTSAIFFDLLARVVDPENPDADPADFTDTVVNDAVSAFNETIYGVVAGMMALSGSSDHIKAETSRQAIPATLNALDVEEEGGVDFPYICTVWEFTGERFGSTSA